MKFSAEKAGKKAKCPKCGTLAVIQMEEPASPAPEARPQAPDHDAKKAANEWRQHEQCPALPAEVRKPREAIELCCKHLLFRLARPIGA